MNITDSKHSWRLEHNSITNRKTNEVRSIENTPTANAVAYMHEKTFIKKCANAFATGVWS